MALTAPSMPLMIRSAASRPAHVAEHHFAGEDDRAGIHLVEIGVLRRGAVGRLENRVAGVVVDIGAGRDADATDLRRQRVGEVIAVQIQSSR